MFFLVKVSLTVLRSFNIYDVSNMDAEHGPSLTCATSW